MVTCKTTTSDPLEIQQYNSLTKKKKTFFSQIKKLNFSNIKENLLARTHVMSMTNILTYKFSMVAFCPCTLSLLKRKETNIKCLRLNIGILKSQKIFKYKRRNETNYSSLYTFWENLKFQISSHFYGYWQLKSFGFNGTYITLLQISLKSNMKISVMTAPIISLRQLP